MKNFLHCFIIIFVVLLPFFKTSWDILMTFIKIHVPGTRKVMHVYI